MLKSTHNICLVTMTLVVLSLLAGCSSLQKVKVPDSIVEAYAPDTPVRNITDFTPALACMDQMFIDQQVETIYVTTAPIPDFSESRGSAGYGAREMLISAISEMTRNSGAIHYVAYDRSTPDIIALNSVHPKKNNFRSPDFFLRGAVTQIDNSPWSKQKGFSVNAETISSDIHGTGASNSSSVQFSTLSMDLNMGMVSTYEILPGVSSANSLTITKHGSSGEVSLSVDKIGAIFSISENQARAMSTALRALTELGVVELFGELYDIPYWQCLANIGGGTSDDLEIRNVYDNLDKVKRSDFIATELRRQGYLNGLDLLDIDGRVVLSNDLRAAIAHYRADHAMIGNTLINYRLFAEIYRDSKKELQQLSRPSGRKPVAKVDIESKTVSVPAIVSSKKDDVAK
ncbi:MAG: hypothetical protein JW773_13875 [Desulfuromonadales bacterium]|nr:hypothetical protein [Desulfuromonadales bacterium]